MAVNYNLPPWLKSADTSGAYSKGFGLGLQGGQAQAQIAMERARLNQHAQQQAVDITLRQQQAERDSMVEQQKLEVAKAYHQEQTQLKSQELEQKQQMIQEKIKEAAQHQMQMERFRQAVAAGADPAKAAIEILPGAPGMGGMLSAALRAQKETPNYTPEVFNAPGFPPALYSKRTGTPHFAPASKSPELNIPQLINAADKTLNWSAGQFGGDTNRLRSLQQMALAKAESAMRGGTNAPAAQAEVLALPANKSDMIKGKQYHTKYGVATWDGDGFSSAQPAPAAVETPPDESADLGSE